MYKIFSDATSRADDVVRQILQKRAVAGRPPDDPDNYVLKISGREEYLLGEYPLCQYKVSTCRLTTLLV